MDEQDSDKKGILSDVYYMQELIYLIYRLWGICLEIVCLCLNNQSVVYEEYSLIVLSILLDTLVQIFRILHKMAPPYLQGLFQYSIDVTGHYGRNLHRLYVPQV